jgi:hypothetical protein
MTPPRRFHRIHTLTRIGALALFLSSCRDSGTACVIPPCALPLALTVTITRAFSGGPVSGAFVNVSGPFTALVPCTQGPGTTCDVLGTGGTYELDIGAPGFQTLHRSVTVPATSRPCGCQQVETQHLDVTLSPTA